MEENRDQDTKMNEWMSEWVNECGGGVSTHSLSTMTSVHTQISVVT